MNDVKMKVSELMLNNLVYEYGNIVPVFKIERRFDDHYALNDYTEDEKHLSDIFAPVPLDPTILEKCGFVLNGFKQYEMEIIGQSCAKRTLEFAGDYLYLREISNPKNRFDDDIITLWNKDLMKTFYLHSLQNLVFALTGSPLKISL